MHARLKRWIQISAVVASSVAPVCGWPQESSVEPRFEVASVKPHQPDRSLPSGTQDPGSLILRDVSLRTLIQLAYRILGYQLVAPGWMDSARFDISALKPPGTRDDMVPGMLRVLLQERFSLRIHHESRPMRVNALVVGKTPPKIATPAEQGIGRIGFGPHNLRGRSSSMAALAAVISRWTDDQVVDLTGLEGAFDFDLNWEPEENQPRPTPAELSAALESQLGLKLESRKIPIDFVVVDHAEKSPTEN